MLINGPHYVSRVAEELLADRTVEQLSAVEMSRLLRSYNAVGASQATAYVSQVAVSIYPESIEFCRIRSNAVLNTMPLDDAVTEHLKKVAEYTQHCLFWQLALADYFVVVAWGQDEEYLGGEPEDFGYLDRAVQLLLRPGLLGYYNENFFLDGLNGLERNHFTFEEWFDGLFRFERYKNELEFIRNGAKLTPSLQPLV